MFVPRYLFRSRHGIFYFRWPLPTEFHPQRRQSTIKYSLGTREPRTALILARELSYVAGVLVARGLRTRMRYDELRRTIRDHFAGLLERRKAEILTHGRLTDDEITAIANSRSLAAQALQTGETYDPNGDDTEMLTSFARKHGIPYESGTREYDLYRQDFLAAFRDVCDAVLAHDSQYDRFQFDAGTGAVGAAERTLTQLESLRAGGGPDTALGAVAKAYYDEARRGGQWAGKTELEKAEHLSLLKEVLGSDIDIALVGAGEARKVKEVLSRYPKNRNKNQRTRGLTLTDALDVQGVDTISIVTINKSLQTYSVLFKWAKSNGYVDLNPFEAMQLRQGKRAANDDRTAFKQAQLQRMLEVLTDPNAELIRKEHQRWGGLIGIYSGARLNAIAQLRLEDIQCEDNIWYFDITDDGDGQRLKSAGSRRRVPIHRALIKQGLLAYRDELKAQGETRLFPTYTYCPRNGWGRSLGRWFNDKFLTGLELKTSQLVYHSLRHSVVTHLSQADVQEPIIKALVGHAQEGVTQRNYNRTGFTLRQLYEAIHKLPYGVDVEPAELQVSVQC